MTLRRITLFLAKTWTLLALTVVIYSALYLPQAAVTTDYIMTFYVAGRLVATGRAADLYPAPDAQSFTGSAFDRAAHELLPLLPQKNTGAYMYSPLIAWLFVPLSRLPSGVSLLLWQGLSLVALALSAALLARVSRFKASDIFFFSFLFFPVFITVWIGQLGIVLGLLPLCAGYFLLINNRPFSAGLAWSLLSLKPQYLPSIGLVGLALALSGRAACLTGIIAGGIALILANLLPLPADVTRSWLSSFHVADATYASGLYTVPIQLITSLPSNLLMLFPVDQRSSLKLPIYGLAAVIWLVGLWHSRKLAASHLGGPAKIAAMSVIGLCLLPLVPPHMLYYDLCLLVPAGVVLLGGFWPGAEGIFARRGALAAWIGISSYFVILESVNASVELPLFLEFLLSAFFVAMLILARRMRLQSGTPA